MQWFKHDIGSYKSDQIQALRISAGSEAVDAYYALVEEIYENEGSLTLVENDVKTRSVLHGLLLGFAGFSKLLESIEECGLLDVKRTENSDGKQVVTVKSRRASREISEMSRLAEIARQNGKKGGRPRKKKPRENPAGSQREPSGNPVATQRKPDYKTNKTIEKEVSKDTSKKKTFDKPTSAEVREYATSIGHPDFDADKFIDYYDSNGWKVGKNPMKDWKAAVRNWARRESSDNPKTLKEVARERGYDKYTR